MTLLEIALDYAAHGWFVFPCHESIEGECSCGTPKCGRAGKHPRTTHGLHDATLDVEQIAAWWTRWPDANIAIRTGRDSNLWVLDFDSDAALAYFETTYGKLPTTLWSSTPHGHHGWFSWREGLVNTAGEFGPAVDTRGEGGYIIAPPSTRDGQSYEWVTPYEWYTEDKELAAPPEWADPPPKLTPVQSDAHRELTVEDILRDRVNDVRTAQVGQRNATLNKAAVMLGHYVPHRISGARVADNLLAAALDNGLPEHEARATIASGLRKGMDEPREYERVPAKKIAPRNVDPLVIRPLASFEERDVEFFWGNRIPLGKLTVLSGYAKQGKSYLTLALAAHVTAGVPLPDLGGQDLRGDVLLCSYEDDPEDTIHPRARRLGVDSNRLHIMQGARTDDGTLRPFNPSDGDKLAEHIVEHPDIRLAIIDPLGSFMGSNVDPNAENQMRAVLKTLADAAQQTGAAIVVVAHHNKGEASTALHKVSGSQGITAIARSVLMAGDTGNGQAIVHAAANLSAQAPSIGYQFEGDEFRWGEIVNATANSICFPSSQKQKAKEFLLEELSEGPVPANEIIAKGKERGHSPRTLRRAKEKLGIDSERRGNKKDDAHWLWTLESGDESGEESTETTA